MAMETKLQYGINRLHLDEDYVLVVAIDFGTTYSGYTFSFKSSPDEIRCNREWGNDVGFKSYKTPTCVLTDTYDNFKAFGYEALNLYSGDVELDKNYHMYDRFKMALFKEKVIGTKTTILSKEGRSLPAETIIAMSLEYIKGHVLDSLEHAEVGEINPDHIRWVLTVPAIWSEGAKQLMRRAAYKANIISNLHSKKLVIALEPEAASYWCRSLPLSQYEGSGTTLKTMPEGTTYMIVDCGGGTIDLTVHRVLVDGGLSEVHKANGGDWGGIKVDDGFLQILDDVFGENFISKYKKKYPRDWLDLSLKFETKKRSYMPTRDSNLNISLSYNLGEAARDELGKSLQTMVQDAQLEGVSFSQGMLVLKPHIVDMLFKPVVTRIVSHIGELLDKDDVQPTEYIFLVGGFSDCKVLSQRIVEQFGSDRKVLIPQDCGISVMKGAAMFGHNPGAIRSRIARRTYGSFSAPVFNSGIHDPSKRVLIDGVERIDNILWKWVLNNESVEMGIEKIFEFVPRTRDSTEFYLSFYSTERNVTYTTEDGVEEIGSITLPIPDIHLPVNDRKVKLHVYFGGTEIYVSIEDTIRGTTKDTTIDFLSGEK